MPMTPAMTSRSSAGTWVSATYVPPGGTCRRNHFINNKKPHRKEIHMSTLLRFDPFREIDRMFDQAVSQTRQPSFPMDAYRHGDTVVVHFDLPGVNPESIDIEYERQTLLVSAERNWRPVDGDQ